MRITSLLRHHYVIIFSLNYNVESVDLLETHTMVNVDLLYEPSIATGTAKIKMPGFT